MFFRCDSAVFLDIVRLEEHASENRPFIVLPTADFVCLRI